MEGLESKNSGDIPKVVEDFDLYYERFLAFDEKDYDGNSIKKYLDSLIEKRTFKRWAEIAVTCRRMIICDRELDLGKGTELMNDSIETFKTLNHEDRPYEAMRYVNTCGLISFRRGDYSSASKYFEQAKEMATKFNMNSFFPDMTSNAIRAKFDLFRYTLPQGQIKSEDVKYYRERFKSFIKDFCAAIHESPKYKTDVKRLKLIYAHGMASLYHNLGDVLGEAGKKEVLDTVEIKEILKNFDSEITDKEAAHRKSLKWGEDVDDKYRQLQSKDQLCKCDIDEEEKNGFEKDILNGGWARGKQFVLQRKIKKSKDTKYINDLIKGNVNFDDEPEPITVTGGLKIGEDEKDKMVALHNYDAIKKAINNGLKGIKDKSEKDMSLLGIAKNKIEVVKKLRKEFYLLYRRQAIHLIQYDILEIIDDFWDKKDWKEVINTSERYSCRDLIELAQISLAEGLKPTGEQLEKINQCKKEILGIDEEEIKKHSKSNLNIPLSLTLDDKTHDKSLPLILAYESVLERASNDFEWPEWAPHEILVKVLQKIPHEENTAVLKFLIP
jgi:tetratricopeptide (TPR) repeat protein